MRQAITIRGVGVGLPRQQGSRQRKSGTQAQNLPAELRQRLTDAGITNLRIPSSFVVQAKDKQGHPVLMQISPGVQPRRLYGAEAGDEGRKRRGRFPYALTNTHPRPLQPMQSLTPGCDVLNIYRQFQNDVLTAP